MALTSRPRLLFLCQTLPYPPDGGVWIRTYHILRLLAQAFDITALCFERSGQARSTHDVRASRSKLSELGRVDVFPLPHHSSRIRLGWNHARSLLLGRVYTTYVYDSAAFETTLRKVLRSERFDLVHLDSLDLARYLPLVRHLPTAVVHHDIESELLGLRANLEDSWWLRAYLRHQSRLMARVERQWCPQIDLNVMVSERDARLLEQHAPGSRVAVVPNGVDTEAFRPGADADPAGGIAYVGGTSPFPNFDALTHFCEQILPRLRAIRGDTRVRWIGRATPEQQSDFRQRYGVELTGYVDDVRPMMREAACHIVPLRAGGGTRLKILNSWAMGKAVVSTSNGCEGLATAHGQNILVQDDPGDFADAVAAVLHDRSLRTRLGSEGRTTVERLYSWDVIGQGLLHAYLNLTRQEQAHERVSGVISRHTSAARA